MNRVLWVLFAIVGISSYGASPSIPLYGTDFERYTVGTSVAQLTREVGSHIVAGSDDDSCVGTTQTASMFSVCGFPWPYVGFGSRAMMVDSTGLEKGLSFGVTPNESRSIGRGVVQDSGETLYFDSLVRFTMRDEPLEGLPAQVTENTAAKSAAVKGLIYVQFRGLVCAVDEDIALYQLEVCNDYGEPVATNWCAYAGCWRDGSVIGTNYMLRAQPGGTLPCAESSFHRLTIERKIVSDRERDFVGYGVLIDGVRAVAADGTSDFLALKSAPSDPARALRFCGTGCVDDLVITKEAPSYLEATCYITSDNMRDTNMDGVPDIYVAKYSLDGCYDGASLRDDNRDEDYFPQQPVAYSSLIPGVQQPGPEPFTAKMEIRGYGDSLNDAPVLAGLSGVVPNRVYTDPATDKNSTLSPLEYLAWRDYVGAHPAATVADWTPERPSDPTLPDTDGDDVSDGIEYWWWYRAHVGYFDELSNHVYATGRRYVAEHMPDGVKIESSEIESIMDPIVAHDFSSCDSDGDGLFDELELILGTSPFDFDTDRDGIPDGYELLVTKTDPLKSCTNPPWEDADIVKVYDVSCEWDGKHHGLTVVNTNASLTMMYAEERTGPFSENQPLYDKVGVYTNWCYAVLHRQAQGGEGKLPDVCGPILTAGIEILPRSGGGLPDGKYSREIGGFTWAFYVSDGEVSIGVYTPEGVSDPTTAVVPRPTGVLAIPSEIEGMPVTRIGPYAFAYCDELTRVVVPSDVREIGTSAFMACTSLESVVLPEGLREIGYGAFEACWSLYDVNFPSGLERIGGNAFAATSLCSVMLPESLVSLGEAAFSCCNSLEGVMIDECNENFYVDESGALLTADGLTLLYFPIGEPIYIPSGVKRIGDEVFASNVSSIGEELILPESIEEIGVNAFSCCALSGISFPQGLRVIELCAFQNNNCATYEIPSTVERIGEAAFASNLYLASVCFDGDAPTVGGAIFQGTDAVTVYVREGTAGWGAVPGQWPVGCPAPGHDSYARPTLAWTGYPTVPEDFVIAFTCITNSNGEIYITGIDGRVPTTIKIPEELNGKVVRGIADRAFEASRLGPCFVARVEIPDSVKYIGDGAFGGLGDIRSVVVPAAAYRMSVTFPASYDNIQRIEFCESVKDIPGQFALNCIALEEIDFPASLEQIGPDAFAGCSALKELTFPSGLETIGEDAFRGCYFLESVMCPPSVRLIERGAFYDCCCIRYVEIPNPVCEWQYAFFSCTSVKSALLPGYKVGGSYQNGSIGECFPNLEYLEFAEGTEVLPSSVCRNLQQLKSVALPESVERIDYGAFSYCYDLTNVVINGVVKEVGYQAFSDCVGLETITFPEGLETIGDRAFAGCSNLTTANIPSSVTKVGRDVFDGCDKLVIETLYIGGSDRRIWDREYAGKTGIRSVVIGEGVEYIGWQAFFGCTGITNVVFPDSLWNIEYQAFAGCTGLKAVTIPKNVWSVDSTVFEGCTNLEEMTILSTEMMGGALPFDGCDNLKVLNLAVSPTANYRMRQWYAPRTPLVINVLPGANVLPVEYFEGCAFVGELRLPSGMVWVGRYSVADCPQLTRVVLPESIRYIEAHAFQHCRDLVDVQLPTGLVSIGDFAFDHTSPKFRPVVPNTTEYIGSRAFGDIDVTDITLEPGNPNFEIADGVLYRLEGGVRVAVHQVSRTHTGRFEVSPPVREISPYAFDGCTGLTEVVIHEGVEYIGDWAFTGCENLRKLSIPSTVSRISGSALRSVPFGGVCISEDNVRYYRDGDIIYERHPDGSLGIFGVDRGYVGTLTVPADVSTIGENACRGCDAITVVRLGEGVVDVGDNAFDGCEVLRDVDLGGTVTNVGASAFHYCKNLAGVSVPKSVITVGDACFSGCTSLTNVVFAGQSIGYMCFAGCGALSNVKLCDGVNTISDYAFEQCKKLEEICIPASVAQIGYYVFGDCTALKSASVSCSSLGDLCFYNCSALDHVVFTGDVKSIGRYAFGFCDSLTDVHIPSSVTNIGNSAFSYCSALTNVTVLAKCIGDSAFRGCSSLSNAVVASTIVGMYAFSSCVSLVAVSVLDGVESVGTYAFECCSLGKVVLPASVTNLDYSAFGYGHISLTNVVFGGRPPEGIGTSSILSAASMIKYPRRYAAEYAPYVKESVFAGFSDAEPPVISPEDRTVFDDSLTVNITSPDLDAVIHYTTNGVDPTVDSPVYRRFRVFGRTEVKAIAVSPNAEFPSEVVSARYAKGICGAPKFSVEDGTEFCSRDFPVEIIYEGTEGVLHYTIDGSEPTSESPVYDGPVLVSESCTIRACVFGTEYFDSEVASVTVVRVVPTVPAPTITIAEGESFVGTRAQVTIACEKQGARIRFTTDGSDPTQDSPLYVSPFYVFESTTVKAFAAFEDWRDSLVTTSNVTKVVCDGDYLGDPDAMVYNNISEIPWVRTSDVGLDEIGCMQSGDVAPGGVTTIRIVVNGKGKVLFNWKTDTVEDEYLHDWNHLEFVVDGKIYARLDGEMEEWKQEVFTVSGEGDHELEWRFVRPYDDSLTVQDCGWIDNFIWVPSAKSSVVTLKTEVPVPYSWLDKYGLIGALTPNDAANALSGKVSAFGEPMQVWEDYVAGTDPTNPNSEFKVSIEFEDGTPVVHWDPDLNEDGKKSIRKYVTSGCKTLGSGWVDMETVPEAEKPLYRFFKVTVDMP